MPEDDEAEELELDELLVLLDELEFELLELTDTEDELAELVESDELALEVELVALELTMLLTADELLPVPSTDVLGDSLFEPLQALSTAVSITHDTARMGLIDRFITTTWTTRYWHCRRTQYRS